MVAYVFSTPPPAVAGYPSLRGDFCIFSPSKIISVMGMSSIYCRRRSLLSEGLLIVRQVFYSETTKYFFAGVQ